MANNADSETPTYCAGCGRRLQKDIHNRWVAVFAEETRDYAFHFDYYDQPIKHVPGYGTASYWLNAGQIPENY